MDKSKEIYLVISDAHDPSLEFGESIRETTAVASNFKKAYDLALSMGNIKVPTIGYRAALERTNRDKAFQLEDQLGPSKVTIALIKKW